MFDVLIVGGGMVGASLAAALQPLDLKVGVIDAFAFGEAQQPSYDDRSIALSYGSSRIYQGMGLWQDLVHQTAAIKHIHVSDRGHFGATRIDAAKESVPALGYVVESRVLGGLLYERLKQSDVELIMPAKVVSAAQCEDSVELCIERDNQQQRVATRLLVVADGANSSLREKLGIQANQRDYGQSAIIANVTTEQPHENIAYERFTPSGPLALLPMTENRYSLVWTQKTQDVERVMAWDDETFLAELQKAFGYRKGCFIKAGKRSQYPLALIKSEREIAGRAVIMGNASHALHPVAGQGLNLSLRDVATLADTLVLALKQNKDVADAELLEQYQQQRQADYKVTIPYTDTLIRVFSNDDWALGHLRAGGLMLTDRIPPLRQWLSQQSMGLNQRKARLSRGLALRM